MKTLEDLRRPLFESIESNNIENFEIAFDEFDSTLTALNPEVLGRDFMQPWYKIYGDLYETIIPHKLVPFYAILLRSRTSPVNMPDKVPLEIILQTIEKTFQHLVAYFDEEMMLTYIKHLRNVEMDFPEESKNFSVVPTTQLLMSDISLEFLSKMYFECQYQPDQLIYQFFIPLVEMGPDFFFNHQDRLAMLLHYVHEEHKIGYVKSLAQMGLKEVNGFFYVALLNYLNSHVIGLRPEELHEEMKKIYKDNEKVNEILNGIEIK